MKPWVLIVTSAVALLEATGPFWYLQSRITIAFVCVLIAILHGTLDQLIARRVLGEGGPRFIGLYITAAVLMACAVYVAPVAALSFFVLLAAIHFGEGESQPSPPGRARLWHFLARGALIVGAPLLLHMPAIKPTLGVLGVAVGEFSGTWPLALTAVLALVRGLSFLVSQPHSSPRILLELFVITFLLVVAHPLISFSVYFGLWHSLAHIQHVHARIAPNHSQLGLARAALPILVPTIGGVVALGAAALWIGVNETSLAVTFALLAALTVPHSWLIARLNGTHSPKVSRPEYRLLSPVRPINRGGHSASLINISQSH